jgi:site-specific recombinase XerD
MRVTNLQKVYYTHLNSLLNKQSITQIKTGQSLIQQIYPWQSGYSKIISNVEADIKLLIDSKKDEEGPFTMSREHLNRGLNEVLKKASIVLGKHLRTHSFRINMATEIISQYSPVAAQKVLGHSNINTTMKYDRGGFSQREAAQVIRSVVVPNRNKENPNKEDIYKLK